jgi:outer membrane protein OmpU
VNKWEVGVNYALGPGIKLVGGGMLYTASGPTNAVSGNSWVILLGMDLRF